MATSSNKVVVVLQQYRGSSYNERFEFEDIKTAVEFARALVKGISYNYDTSYRKNLFVDVYVNGEQITNMLKDVNVES